ncbi:MAG: 3-dehydroquinate dehydratase [Rhodococcus sp.]|uniref:type II 3-dehydroquinate dehydratase n=1 Tax=Rhodococcus sp. TaxID=1831 RepID=UPI00169B76A5|nr:type II 3-dehydroquinate dehydratase [Rhodococcus sp. (in: high G+C Gram-positive bacteria)]NLV81349.1 3-dehydroquinate dehydratase [Rhodococcus sp. (in: high G+C Gram-positive bacteria)]
MTRPILAVLSGANLNLLGARQPELYGTDTLADVEALCTRTADTLGYDLDFRQTNHEGVLIESIHELRTTAAGFVVNAGAWTHTSIALHDALVTTTAPVVEVHLTNIHARESFRQVSYVSPVATAVIAGCGPAGYAFALHHLAALDLATRTEAVTVPQELHHVAR